MAWRDKLQQGKFREAIFYTVASDITLGRRTARHDYPKRDKPYIEDLGRQGKEYSFECYVYADGDTDYFVTRDALADALDKKGSGVLVHPYLGTLKVSVVSARYRESSDQGGLATFSITFAETDEIIAPDETTDTINQLSGAVDDVEAGSIIDFVNSFSVDRFASFVSDAAEDLLGDFATEISGLASFAGSVISLVSGFPGNLKDPTGIANTVIGLISQVSTIADLKQLASFANDVAEPTLTTASRVKQLANQKAIISLIRTNAVGQIAYRITTDSVSLDTKDAAFAYRDSTIDLIDDIAPDVGFNSYDTLMTLRAATVLDLNERVVNLPSLKEKIQVHPVPNLVLLWGLYQSIDNDQDLIDRNNIRNPVFVSGPVQYIA